MGDWFDILEDAAREHLQAQGWTLLEDLGAEGPLMRARVGRGEETALLHVSKDEAALARLGLCASDDFGGQLFTVPDLRELGDGWILTEDTGGHPLNLWLQAQGLSSFWELPVARAGAMLEQMGQALRKVHSVVHETTFGGLMEREPRWTTFSGFAAARLERAQLTLNSDTTFTQEQRQGVLATIGDLRHELASFHPRYPASWAHGAPAWENFWVDEAGREIVGLTGFDVSCYLPAEYDLAYFLWMQPLGDSDALLRRFYQGYGAARTMDVQRRERFYRRLIALDALAGHTYTSRSKGALLELASPASL